MNLSTSWTRHIQDQDRREDFEKVLRNNSLLFKRLNEIAQEWEASLNSEETSKDQYQSPAWACLQAHRNGSRETIKKLKDLISFAV